MIKKRIGRKIALAVSLLIFFVFLSFISVNAYETKIVRSEGGKSCETFCEEYYSSGKFGLYCLSLGTDKDTATNGYYVYGGNWNSEYGYCADSSQWRGSSYEIIPSSGDAKCKSYTYCKCAVASISSCSVTQDPNSCCIRTYQGTTCRLQDCSTKIPCPAGEQWTCGANPSFPHGTASECRIPTGETWIPGKWDESWKERFCYCSGSLPASCSPYQNYYYNCGGLAYCTASRNWKFSTVVENAVDNDGDGYFNVWCDNKVADCDDNDPSVNEVCLSCPCSDGWGSCTTYLYCGKSDTLGLKYNAGASGYLLCDYLPDYSYLCSGDKFYVCDDNDASDYSWVPATKISSGNTMGSYCCDPSTNIWNTYAVENTAELCGDSVDNDCDGAIDRADSGCVPTGPISPGSCSTFLDMNNLDIPECVNYSTTYYTTSACAYCIRQTEYQSQWDYFCYSNTNSIFNKACLYTTDAVYCYKLNTGNSCEYNGVTGTCQADGTCRAAGGPRSCNTTYDWDLCTEYHDTADSYTTSTCSALGQTPTYWDTWCQGINPSYPDQTTYYGEYSCCPASTGKGRCYNISIMNGKSCTKNGQNGQCSSGVCVTCATQTCPTTGPGCRSTAPSNSEADSTKTCCSGQTCYKCKTGYTWNSTTQTCGVSCTNDPGCTSSGTTCSNGVLTICTPGIDGCLDKTTTNCASGQVCSNNTCCTKKTCSAYTDCSGSFSDGCGGTISCCCADGSSCTAASTCCSPYCADTLFTGSKICKNCSLSTDQWCNGKMAGCYQGTYYTDPDRNSFLCQSCDNSSPERYWFSDVSGCCGDDENDYFNDGSSGGCWNKTRILNNYLVTGYNEVTVYDGKFHGCAIDHEWAINNNDEGDSSRTNKKPYKNNDWMKTLQDNIANSILITDHTYCDNISSGANKKFCSYKEEWIESSLNRTHLSYINWSEQIDWTTTTIQEAECCEPMKCWNGSNCVDNQAATQDIYTYPGTNLRCIEGEWKESPLKYPWDRKEGVAGYCPTVQQCLVTPNGNYNNNNNPSMFNYNYLDDPTSSSNSNSPQCINDDQYIGDHYCEKGEWTTRTKLLALQLLSVTESSSDQNNYTLFCDDYDDSLNYYKYTVSIGASTNYIDEYFKKQTNGCKIYPESAPGGVVVPCANKVCVLEYEWNNAEEVVVGVSLNQPLNATKYSFLEALSKSSTYCQDAMVSDGKFHRCSSSSNDLWYNHKLQLVVYAKNGVALGDISFWDKFVLFLKTPFSSVFNTIINVIKPSAEGGAAIDYDFINKTSNFDRIYLDNKGAAKSVRGVTEKIGSNEFLAITYTGVSADVCESVETYINNNGYNTDVINCDQTDSTYYVETRYETRLNSWYDLTSKLRVQ